MIMGIAYVKRTATTGRAKPATLTRLHDAEGGESRIAANGATKDQQEHTARDSQKSMESNKQNHRQHDVVCLFVNIRERERCIT